MAIIGWLILIIESVVAAPVWAAAHAMPEGEGIAGQHGRTGYMMLLNVLLRPALMVFGFMIAMALVGATSMLAAYMLQQGIMSAAMNDTGLGGWGGPFALVMSFVSSIVIITVTMVTVVHKTFTLITWLPEKVMTWAGSGASSLGEESDERRVAGVFGTVGQNVAAGAQKANKPGKPASKDSDGGGDGADDGKMAAKDEKAETASEKSESGSADKSKESL